MPAKKPAPKSAKGKKAASRPPAHKPTLARTPAERVQGERFPDAVVPNRAVPPRSTPTTEDTIEMRKAVEPDSETLDAPEPGASGHIVVPPRANPVLQSAADS